jgi:hypothetical protein
MIITKNRASHSRHYCVVSVVIELTLYSEGIMLHCLWTVHCYIRGSVASGLAGTWTTEVNEKNVLLTNLVRQ